MTRWPVILFALVMAAVPFVPGMPPFWLVLLKVVAGNWQMVYQHLG